MTNFSGRAWLLAIALLGGTACAGAAARRADSLLEQDESRSDRLWVLAPHPDDEVLMAGDLLRRSVRAGRPVTVLVMTNGDLGCERNGYAREAETIAALESLGVREEDVRFLGYPDGWLDSLGDTPLPPIARTQPDGSCGTGTGTYAVRGAGGVDVHRQLTGVSGPYVASGPVEDLAALLERERPSEIVVAHGIDTHPDHAMTYVYLRRALERAHVAPRILRSVVHQGPCWPNGAGHEPCPDIRSSFGTPMPPFAEPLDRYRPSLRAPSEDGGAGKRAAIARYTSQLGTPNAEESWLSSFARTDEVFWSETFVDEGGRLVRPSGAAVTSRAAIALAGGSATIERAGVTLTVDARGLQLGTGGTALRQLPWPHGDDPTSRHEYELRFDPRSDEDVTEVTLRRDGALLCIAVIPNDLSELLCDPATGRGQGATIEIEGSNPE